jgi:NAD(P) transhydrogenase
MEQVVESVYMLCSILFILCLGGLSTQETARKGNAFGVISMFLAIVVTIFLDDFNSQFKYFVPPFAVGGLLGLVLAVRVEMINMPQMVAVLHSFVGLAATIVGYSKYVYVSEQSAMDNLEKVETFIGVFIGAITFTGSVVAYGKLQGTIRSTPLMICGPGRHVINFLVIVGSIVLGVGFGYYEDGLPYLGGMTLLALFLGWHLVMAIGGADMPVVVSMLNSYSGWATSASGFLLKNNLLIITGALVGSSGAILSYIMCRAMNRSFFSVIMGGFGQGTTTSAPVIEGTQVQTDCKTFVNELQAAKSVIIVPGYGMAVARAQHDCGALVSALRKQGKRVNFCIHPVAGRLPGHMNVLLAEANVPYDIVKEMDELNKEFSSTDISIVLGANDIVNPDALDNPTSTIAGMPVCQVWKSKRVVVFKRGGGAGYAGIDNPLFVKPNTRMYFGSADKSIKEILQELNARGVVQAVTLDTKPKEAETYDEQEVVDEIFPEPTMQLGIVKETYDLERRVAMTPNNVKRFRRLGFSIIIESEAGKGAGYRDHDYTNVGARVVQDKRDVFQSCDILMKVRKPSEDEASMLGHIKVLICYFNPSVEEAFLKSLAVSHPQLTIMAMDCVPRITRAQKLDSLSSMGNIAGYRAVIESMSVFQKCPKAQITAAGKLPPARVFIIGCGVAGLAAIGYLKALGCIVKAFDSRPAAREQAESLGAEFIEVKADEDGTGVGGYAKAMSEAFLKAQMAMTKDIARRTDIIITTALIPGMKAPILVTEDIVRVMKPGSVILDMAAEMGGNVELTKRDRVVFDHESGVSIIGFTDLVSRMAPQSSELYSTNLWHLLDDLGGAAKFRLNMDDEIVSNMTVVHQGRFTWIPLSARPAPEPPKPRPAAPVKIQSLKRHQDHDGHDHGSSESCCDKYSWLLQVLLLGCVFVCISLAADAFFLNLFLIFTLAIVIGYMVIWNVSAALHTPLMSVTNAVSGIIVIGAMLELNPAYPENVIDLSSGLGIAGVFFASINVVGGFLVTYRMLQMFRKA